jgi:hypothetical protein
MVRCINLIVFLISSPSPLWWGKGGMGVDVLDFPPPPESSPTVGRGAIFWLNWGIGFYCFWSIMKRVIVEKMHYIVRGI